MIQVFLPLYDNARRRIARQHFELTARELTDEFGGLTAQTRAPVKGLWGHGPRAKRDDLVIYEVFASRPSRRWWTMYRRKLERRFRQEKILVRVFDFTEL